MKRRLLEGLTPSGIRTTPLLDDPVHHPDVLGKASAAGFKPGGSSRLSCTSDTGQRPCVGSSSNRRTECDGRPSPGRRLANFVTPSPTAATTPAVSCPKMRGAECEPVAIFFRSVPQMPQVCTRTSISPGANLRHRHRLQADIVHAVIDRGHSGRRDGPLALFHRELSRHRHGHLPRGSVVVNWTSTRIESNSLDSGLIKCVSFTRTTQ